MNKDNTVSLNLSSIVIINLILLGNIVYLTFYSIIIN